MLLLILQSCSLVKLKNQLSLMILVLDSRCRIRLDNLELKRIFKDFSFLLGSPPFSYRLKIFSRGSSKSRFFSLFWIWLWCIFAFWNSSNEMSFVFAQVFALQSALKFSFLLIDLIANFGDATKLFIIIYLFFLKECDRLFAKLFYTYFKVIIYY